MSEILAPTRKNIASEFARVFEGMTDKPLPLDDLLETREMMIADLVGRMPDLHRRFLVSFEKGQPEWDLLSISGIDRLPAVKWRQQNLDKLNTAKRSTLVTRLEEVLFTETT